MRQRKPAAVVIIKNYDPQDPFMLEAVRIVCWPLAHKALSRDHNPSLLNLRVCVKIVLLVIVFKYTLTQTNHSHNFLFIFFNSNAIIPLSTYLLDPNPFLFECWHIIFYIPLACNCKVTVYNNKSYVIFCRKHLFPHEYVFMQI